MACALLAGAGLAVGQAGSASAATPLTDLGLFGGNSSNAKAVNNNGKVIGASSTNTNEVDAFTWIDGGFLAQLYGLGGPLTIALAVNDAGQVAGQAFTPGFATAHAILWSAGGTVTDLGTLGGSTSAAAALNARGQVVGSASTPGNAASHAFIWTAGVGMLDLGTLGGTGSESLAVNDSGQVVGWADTATGAQHAFSWTAAGGMVDLGALGGPRSEARGVTASGQVIGDVYLPDQVSYHAFSWTSSGGMVDLGTLGGSSSHAAAVNAAGEVVGSAEVAGAAPHAFAWTAAGGMVDLGTFGGPSSFATAISSSGQVVGSAELADNRTFHAFSWTAGGGMLDLGTLGGPGSFAASVNDHGQVVGSSYVSDGPFRQEHAFSVIVAPPQQTITFPAPATGVVGGSAVLTAVASSGLPVSYQIDPGSPCTVSGSQLSFVGPGLCTVSASQPGNGSVAPATAIRQAIPVVYRLAGYSSPEPGEQLSSTDPRFQVAFRLTDASGRTIPRSASATLTTSRAVVATVSGPGITALTASCRSTPAGAFRCAIPTPAGVMGRRTPYAITAAEIVAGTSVPLPGGTALTVYFEVPDSSESRSR